MISEENILSSTKNRFQFLATVALFFPVILDALHLDADSGFQKVHLVWSIMIAILIVNYILLELLGLRINRKVLRAINWCILAALGAYAIFLFLTGELAGRGYLPHFFEYIFRLATFGIDWLPFAIFGLLLYGSLFFSKEK